MVATGSAGAAVGAIVMGVAADPKSAASWSVNNLNPEPCVDHGKQTDLAIMLGVTAAPLLTMPLVYLFRRGEKKLKTELSPVSKHADREAPWVSAGSSD